MMGSARAPASRLADGVMGFMYPLRAVEDRTREGTMGAMKLIQAMSCIWVLGATAGACALGTEDQAIDPVADQDASELVVATHPLLVPCLALSGSSILMKENFCRTLRDSAVASRCWSKTRLSRVEWVGWCYFEFSD